MTTLTLLASKTCYENITLVVKKLNKQGLHIDIKAEEPDEDNYRMIEVKSATAYGIYAIGLEMGKLSTMD